MIPLLYVLHNDGERDHYHHVRRDLSLGPALFEIPDLSFQIYDYQYILLRAFRNNPGASVLMSPSVFGSVRRNAIDILSAIERYRRLQG